MHYITSIFILHLHKFCPSSETSNNLFTTIISISTEIPAVYLLNLPKCVGHAWPSGADDDDDDDALVAPIVLTDCKPIDSALRTRHADNRLRVELGWRGREREREWGVREVEVRPQLWPKGWRQKRQREGNNSNIALECRRMRARRQKIQIQLQMRLIQ